MPVTARHDPATGIWTIEMRGTITREEVLEAATGMRQSASYEATQPRLWDASSTDPRQPIAASDLRAIAETAFAAKTGGRVAVLVGRDVDFGIARIYKAYSDSLPADVRIFRDREEALAFLTEG